MKPAKTAVRNQKTGDETFMILYVSWSLASEAAYPHARHRERMVLSKRCTTAQVSEACVNIVRSQEKIVVMIKSLLTRST